MGNRQAIVGALAKVCSICATGVLLILAIMVVPFVPSYPGGRNGPPPKGMKKPPPPPAPPRKILGSVTVEISSDDRLIEKLRAHIKERTPYTITDLTNGG